MIASQQSEIEDLKIKIKQARKKKRGQVEEQKDEGEEEEDSEYQEEQPMWPAESTGVIVNMMAKFCHKHEIQLEAEE